MKPSLRLAVLLAVIVVPPVLAQERRREIRWNNPNRPKIPGVDHQSFRSRWMDREVGYNVYLPPGYAVSRQLYPVIYYLHGAGGDENSDAAGFSGLVGRLIDSKKIPPVICVFPNGGMSGYRDHREDRVMVESMLLRELIPRIDGIHRTQAAPAGRVMAGFSLGGAGAVRLSLDNPSIFSAAASWGGAMKFGPDELPRLRMSKVRLFLAVGDRDFTLAGNEALVRQLEEAKRPPTYRKLPGVRHNLGAYYRQVGEEALRFLAGDLKPLTPSDPKRDQEVLEALMLDLLRRGVPEGLPGQDPRIHLATDALPYAPTLNELTSDRATKSLGTLTEADLPAVRDAVMDAERRVAVGDAHLAFDPNDRRIERRMPAGPRGPGAVALYRPVFHVSPPGYSADARLAVVKLSFTWSGGFHGAGGVCVLAREGQSWKLRVQRLSYFV